MLAELNEGGRKVLLCLIPPHTKPATDLLERQAIATVIQERGASLGRDGLQGALEHFETLLSTHLQRGIVWNVGSVIQHFLQFERASAVRLAERVLLSHVPGDREEISLRGTNSVGVRDTQQAKEYLLEDVGNVGAVTDATGEKTAQLVAVAGDELSDEGLSGVWR